MARYVVAENSPHLEGEQALRRVTEENVVGQLEHLRTLPAVAAAMANGSVSIHGWIYDIEHAELRAFDAHSGHFTLIDPARRDVPDATPHGWPSAPADAAGWRTMRTAPGLSRVHPGARRGGWRWGRKTIRQAG